MKDLLLTKIMNFQIDIEGDALPFSGRLRRENNWTQDYSERCIFEYQRFLYLATTSKIEVTPSDAVDQVWHLHLLYTKSYWTDLCQETLNCQLHHKPTKGGKTELQRFKSQYQATLDRYLEVFGEQAPEDIWPDTENRFKNAALFVRANKAKSWIIKKPSTLLTAALLTPVFLVACSKNGSDNEAWFYIKMAIGLLGAYYIIKLLSKFGGGGGGGGGCGGFGGDDSGGSGCGGCGGGD